MRLFGRSLSTPRRLVGLAVLVAVLGTGATGAALDAAQAAPLPPGPTTSVPAPNPIDPFATYVGQTGCDPSVKPGAQAILSLAMNHYGLGRNLGITRACGVGATSEHKEGRALDWGVNVNNPAEKAAGDAFTHWLTAEGPDGKLGYNARRLGVMYVIWNRKIWTAYNADAGWKDYFGASPHTDHVHVSLTWNGAYQRTSWWTGNLVANRPVGALDGVSATKTTLTATGWALDPDTSSSTDVHVYVDGVGSVGKAALSRPDVAAAYRKGDKHGYAVTVPATEGPHDVCVYAMDSDPAGNTSLGCRTVVVQERASIGAIDSVTVTGSTVRVDGWSLNPDSSASNDVHVYVGGTGGAVRADEPRPDVGAAHRRGDLHGFSYSTTASPGRHQVCAYGINSVTRVNALLACRSVDVGMTPPVGNVERIVATKGGIEVVGWSVDPDDDASTAVHVYVDGVGAAIRADESRADVAAALGRGDRHGFTYAGQVPAGRHTVCVYALNTGPGAHALLRCAEVTVEDGGPIGSVESIAGGAGAVSASGWVLDPETTDPTSVHVYVDGVGAAVRADGSRPDVDAAFRKGDRHGFTYTRPVAPGTHQVCVYGIDLIGTANRLLRCGSVQVR